jgi:hypothetical protein
MGWGLFRSLRGSVIRWLTVENGEGSPVFCSCSCSRSRWAGLEMHTPISVHVHGDRSGTPGNFPNLN